MKPVAILDLLSDRLSKYLVDFKRCILNVYETKRIHVVTILNLGPFCMVWHINNLNSDYKYQIVSI